MNDISKVIFFNAFHNGDVHVSRGFVNSFVEKFPDIEFYYQHNNKAGILSDISNLRESRINHNYVDKLSYKCGDTMYMNTWYAAGGNDFFKKFDVSFDTLYYLFDDHASKLGTSLSNISEDPINFFPIINFNNIIKDNINAFFLKSKFKKRVFISNGDTMSGQSVNFDFSPIINFLSKKYSDVLFITSNRSKGINISENVISSSSIIKKPGFDLNENAYITTKCDLIVGRSSGAYTFSMIKDNMFDSSKFMLSFSTIGSDDNKYWLSDSFSESINYTANIFNYNYEYKDVCHKIDEVLNGIYNA